MDAELTNDQLAAPNGTSLISPLIAEDEVPASFFRALADFKEGRVVDADKALNDPPPRE